MIKCKSVSRKLYLCSVNWKGNMRKLSIILILWSVMLSAHESDVAEDIKRIGLPVLDIQTVDGELPTFEMAESPEGALGLSIKNATKVPGRLRIYIQGETIYDSGDYTEKNGGMTIRVRGNTSAYPDKKPYKIKLRQAADLLRRGNDEKYQDKNWLLLREYRLNSLIGFKMNELVGLQWTPAYEYVNVLLNGDYIGVYMLVESVRRNEDCRLNVDETGFIFEYDPYWWNEEVYVESPTIPWVLHYTFKYPDTDDLTEDVISYFTDMITRVEYSLKDGTYPDYIDVESFALWMLGHDILGNSDGAGANFYLTKKDNTENSKVMMANLWDFDRIMNTKDEWDAMHTRFYYEYLFTDNENGEFVETYKNKWIELSPAIFSNMLDYLDRFAMSEEGKALDESIVLNNKRWNDDAEDVQYYVERAKDWFVSRRHWLSEAIVGEDFVDGIKHTRAVDDGHHGDYYNIYGQRVKTHRPGIYICQGKKYIIK